MKKVFVFLSICLFALTGLFFACDDDKYANIGIEVVSVSSNSSGKKDFTYNETEKCYEVEVLYGEEFSIEGKVKNVSDISNLLVFDSFNDSIYKLPTQTQTDDGSIASFKANAPSYDESFMIKISSVETDKNAIYVKVKVALPVEEIIMQENMAFAQTSEIDLSDHITYVSSHPESGFMTTQKGVDFKINKFTHTNGTVFDFLNGTVVNSLNENINSSAVVENGQYGIKTGDEIKFIFSLKDGAIRCLDTSYTGEFKIEATSSAYNGENEELKKTFTVKLVKGIDFSDFSFEGGQTGYISVADTNTAVRSKLNASLFINSLGGYSSNDKDYFYLLEQIAYELNTDINVDVSVQEVSVKKSNAENSKVEIEYDNDGKVKLVSTGVIAAEIQKDSNNKGTIKFNSTGKTGDAYYDIVFIYSDFSNKPTFRFSELYKAFLTQINKTEDNSNDENKPVIDYANPCFAFDTSALPSSIVIAENDNQFNFNDVSVDNSMDIYDFYTSNLNYGYGTKVSVNLSLSQSVNSSRIKDENKKVKISAVKDGINIAEYIEIRNFNGNLINLREEIFKDFDNNEYKNYFFEIDLANSYANYFYIKSKANMPSITFNLKFENDLESKITNFAGRSISPDMSDISVSLKVNTYKGVDDIGVFTINAEGAEVKLSNVGTALGNSAIVRLFSSDPNLYQGVLLGVVVDEDTNDSITILAKDTSIVKIFNVETVDYSSIFDVQKSDYSSVFGNDYNNKKLLKCVSVAGLSLGETEVIFKSKNGTTSNVSVKVINAVIEENSFDLSVVKSYGKTVVTESNLSVTALNGTIEEEMAQNVNANAVVSAKVRGSFMLNYNANPNKTGIKSVVYKFKDSNNQEIYNAVKENLGVITTNAVGDYYAYIEFTYYVFSNLSDQAFLTWKEKTIVKAFKLVSYEPATNIRLNKYVANVYDYNSLGFKYKQDAVVSISVNIAPMNASILHKDDVISYKVDTKSGHLSGNNGEYTARLNANETKATEYIYVTIKEYGTEYTLVCTVNIFKAKQIEEIGVSVFDGDKEKTINQFAEDEETIYIYTNKAKTLTFNTSISPTSSSVYVDDLFVKIYNGANDDNSIYMHSLASYNEPGIKYGELSYKNIVDIDNEGITLENGKDSFNLNINDSMAGCFYVIIFAVDGMSSNDLGQVYKKILIEITDGTMENPYVIETISDLIAINEDSTKHYVLGADINLSSITNWDPIAKDGFSGSLNGYNGNIKGSYETLSENSNNVNGKFFKITGLRISELNCENVGLFAKLSSRSVEWEDGVVYSHGAILNLSLVVDYINLNNKFLSDSSAKEVNIGALVGYNEDGLIMNCSVKASNFKVSINNKTANVGGIVGLSKNGAIYNFPYSNLKTNSYVLSDIEGRLTKDVYSSGNTVELKGKDLDNRFAASNPVEVTMTISDSATYAVNAGGIAGKIEGGVVNGIYGVYDYIERKEIDKSGATGVSYLTTFQSQGFDVNVNINATSDDTFAGTICNYNSAIGGVAGKLVEGSVYNTSSYGRIGRLKNNESDIIVVGSYNNVGGLIGKTEVATDLNGLASGYETVNNVYNTLSSVKLRGKTNVGGAVGQALYTNFERVRVENYEEDKNDLIKQFKYENIASMDVALIIIEGSENALGGGGVVGCAQSSTFLLVYSQSFVDNFNEDYMNFGDIYSTSKIYVGGIVGVYPIEQGYPTKARSNGETIEKAFSNFHIVSTNNDAQVGGIIGGAFGTDASTKYLKSENIFYIGVLQGAEISALGNNILITEGSTGATENYCYYLLEYTYDEDDESSKIYYLEIIDSADTISNLDANDLNNNTYWNVWSKDTAYEFEYSYLTEEEGEEIRKTGIIKTRVLVYTVSDKKYNFIKSVSNSITVEFNDEAGKKFVLDSERYIVDFSESSFNSFVDENGKLNIIANYSEWKENIKTLNDLFLIIPTPEIAGRLNIVVSYDLNGNNDGIIDITNEGKININGKTGQNPIVLKFRVRENISAYDEVCLYIVENFDKLLLSNNPNYRGDLFESVENEPFNIRKNSETNVFSALVEETNLRQVSNKVIYNISGNKALVGLVNTTGYNYEYTVTKEDGTVAQLGSDYSFSNGKFVFANKGKYKVDVQVGFSLNVENETKNFFIKSEAWTYYYNVYSGAISVGFNTDEIWMQSNETYSDLIFVLNSDIEIGAGEDYPEIIVELRDSNGNSYIANEERDDENKITEFNFGTSSYLKIKIFDKEITPQGNNYYYKLHLSVNENKKKDISDPIRYTLLVYDNDKVFMDKPASIQVVLAPQGLRSISAVHYRYTQSVSQLENSANTAVYDDPSMHNYAYSFTNEPKNTVVAGSEGLFVVDLYPYYSKIKSISIESSLGSLSGNALQFVQLVRVKNSEDAKGSGYSYIYAPTAMSTGNNGIYLGLYSKAVDNFTNDDIYISTKTINGKDYRVLSSESLKYLFEGLDDNSEMGRLYVKTVAPTNLKEEESFVVTIKVKYMALNDDYEYVEQEFVYNHTLVVESVSDYELVSSHNGIIRNKIAVTGKKYTSDNISGADWLDLSLNITEENTIGDINVSYFTKKGENKGVNSNYFTLYKIESSNEKIVKRLVLGESAEVGGTFKVDVVLQVEYDGYVETRTITSTIYVVDLVIDSIDINGLDENDTLTITVSTSKQLKVIINGYGTDSVKEKAANSISRMVDASYNRIYYWYAKAASSNKYYVGLDSSDIKNLLPFKVNKIAISNELTETFINGEELTSTLEKVILLEGSTSSGSIDIMLEFSFIYFDETNFVSSSRNKAGEIAFVPNGFFGASVVEKYFTVEVKEDSNEDNPTPIYTVEDLIKMGSSTTGNYILMNDIEITNHTALNARFNSFDGNNKVITISSFSYSTNLASSNTRYSINMGLFDTVESGTIIKNVIVALAVRTNDSPMNLTGYSTINFGPIAAINRGIITNCDVISVSDDASSILTYLATDDTNSTTSNYTINIETTDVINNVEVSSNVGLFVGVNESSGVITNSRVGRERIDILTVYDSEATVVYKNAYEKTAPVTLVKVYGKADVGGFVATNSGIISSSFAKNIQIENISKSAKGLAKTAGFVVTNNGYIYGSFASGWEEEDMSKDVNLKSSPNRKLGGGLFSNGSVAGFVYYNASYIEDCYSNINCSGSMTFAAVTSYINMLKVDKRSVWASPAVAGFAYITKSGSYITTSYSLSKIEYTLSSTDLESIPARPNTFGAFEGRMESPDAEFDNSGIIENCYFMLEKTENFSYEHERAFKLSDDPALNLEDEDEEASSLNEFVNKDCFNNFSFDNSFDTVNKFSSYDNTSTGGVWAIYTEDGTHGYPDLISANTIAISCRVINVTKTNASQTNTYYYTYADGYEIGSNLNPYVISNFSQYNNIFKDVVGSESFNDEITTKFRGNIRLINNINFENSEDVYSTGVEFTSNIDLTSIFDGNYLSMYNITLSDMPTGSDVSTRRSSFGLFKDIYYAAVKNVKLVFDSVRASNTSTVGGLAGAIVNSNISNITLASSEKGKGTVTGNNYVGALAGIVVTNDENTMYVVSNIKSNLSIIGNSPGNEVNAITTSNYIWENIKPIANSSGLSAISSNLRLHKLPKNIYYAGGIAGVVDICQINEIDGVYELLDPNVKNVHVGVLTSNSNLPANNISYENEIKIISDYSGGLFGFVGAQTYVERADFIASLENANHYIMAAQVAGGICAINNGKISQSYVGFTKDVTKTLDNAIKEFVEQGSATSAHINSSLFSVGSAKYIGGIAGINAGNGKSGSGTIINCYNRVDVRNKNSIGVGGIVGGSYIGQITNVYTTASLMGKLFKEEDSLEINEDTKIGAIIGKIFENSNDGYFADYHTDSIYGTNNNNLTLTNIVALNLWDSNDFNALYNFDLNGGKIGALYGEPDNLEDEEAVNFIKISTQVYVQNFALRDYKDPYISSVDNNEDFSVRELIDSRSYFELWGVGTGEHSDDYIKSVLNSSLITPNKYRALFAGEELGVSHLRNDYFHPNYWLRSIWNYDDDKLLPVLEYGYEPSVIRIYTANQFIEKLSMGNSSGKLYTIMNDIDFDGYNFGNENRIDTIFRGQLYGNNVTYYSVDGQKYTRKPILFNIIIDEENLTTNYAGIFASSIGATFANFNLVIKNYNIGFSNDVQTEAIASVLVANSVSTNISNVHVYSSLLDLVDKGIFNNDHEYYDSNARSQDITVADGYGLVDGRIRYYSTYIKLATCDSQDESPTENFSRENYFIYTLRDDNGEEKFVLEKYKNGQADEEHYFNLSEPNEYIDDAYLNIEVCSNKLGDPNHVFKIRKASTVGLLTGVGALPYISNSSVNLDVDVSVSGSNSDIYVGMISGRSIGRLSWVVASGKLLVKMDESSTEVADGIYFGGLVGNIQGSIKYCYVKNNTMQFGVEERQIEVTSGNAGVNIGGLFGYISKYSTVNESIVGGAEDLYIQDSTIKAYVSGTSRVGGVVGQNDYSFTRSYFLQRNLEREFDIKVYSYGMSTDLIVGSIIAENNYSTIERVYSNANIDVIMDNCSELNVGGVVGFVDTQILLTNVTYDAEHINVDGSGNSNNEKVLCTENIGGILGSVEENSSVILNYVVSTADLTSIQAKNMFIGGMVGKVPSGNVEISAGLSLGNITLLERSFAFINEKQEVFYTENQFIGGLVGKSNNIVRYNDPNAKSNKEIFLVASTIRDYAIAQKTGTGLSITSNTNKGLNIGPVVGSKKLSEPSGTIDLYYNENISLISDNGYGSYFKALSQYKELGNKAYEVIAELKNIATHDEIYIPSTNSSNLYNIYFNSNAMLDYNSGKYENFYEGSKLNPIEVTENTHYSQNKYYIFTKDLLIDSNASISLTGAENCVINAQGYRYYSNTIERNNVYQISKPIFDKILKGCAIIGLIEEYLYSNNSLSLSGVIAKENHGFMFACGVGGQIRGNGVASLVYSNYGVISSCFSIADIVASSSGSGLVVINGDSFHTGNIYSSFYTGTITPTGTTGTFSGLCNDTTNGAISTSYTMADIDISEITSTNINVYPITVFGNNVGNTNGITTTGNLYKCFYDYVAYTGSYDGINYNDALEQFEFKTNGGIFVWTSSLAGTGGNAGGRIIDSTVRQSLEGSWSKIGDSTQLSDLYKKTDRFKNENDNGINNEIKLDTSWFNFGYITIDFKNILFNDVADSNLETNEDNILRYLTLVYTGNGRSNKENKRRIVSTPYFEEGPFETNGFKDKPYSVKHAGILDVLVNGNNTDRGIDYKYYLFIKNINFVKYTNTTYWSKKWDENKIAFIGDLDGNGKTVSNMYSSNGLLRAVIQSDSNEIPESFVYDFTVKNSYSKTGIIAGGLWYGTIESVKLEYNYVYNGSLKDLKQNETSSTIRVIDGLDITLQKSFLENNIQQIIVKNGSEQFSNNSIVTFAGGIVGYMAGGKIANTCHFNTLYVVASNRFGEAYVGGLVGYMTDGIIEGTKINGDEIVSKWDLRGIYVRGVYEEDSLNADLVITNSTNKVYAGGVAGYVGSKNIASHGTIKDICVKSIAVRAPEYVGGVVGKLDGYAQISGVEYNVTLNTMIISNNKVGVVNKFDVSEVNTKVSTNVMVGGIVAVMKGGKVENCSLSTSMSIQSQVIYNSEELTYVFIGGIIGEILGGEITNCETLDGITIRTNGITNSVIGGIIGHMENGRVVSSKNNAEIDSVLYAGGIVGYLTNGYLGEEDTDSQTEGSLKNINLGLIIVGSENSIAGGIVGVVIIKNGGDCSIINSENQGELQGRMLGGIVGYVFNNSGSQVSDLITASCYNSAKIGVEYSNNEDENRAYIAGGIAGFVFSQNGYVNIGAVKNSGKVIASDTTGKVSFAGGIIGVGYQVVLSKDLLAVNSSNSITGVINEGEIIGSVIAGGIAGYLKNSEFFANTISKNYNRVTGGEFAAGIVAYAENVSFKGYLQNTINGFVKNGSLDASGVAGGIVGVVVGSFNLEENVNEFLFTNSGYIGGNKSFVAGGVIGWWAGEIKGTVGNFKNSGAVESSEGAQLITFNMYEMPQSNEVENGTNDFISISLSDTNSLIRVTDAVTPLIAGGIIGYVAKQIDMASNFVTTGNYLVFGKNYSGGIIGYVDSSASITILNSTNSMSVGNNTTKNAGGIIAYANNKVTVGIPKNSTDDTIVINTGNVLGENAGGIVGFVENGTIAQAINKGDVTGTINAGGIVGEMTGGTIEDTCAIEKKNSTTNLTVNGGSGNAGGVVGNFSGGTIKNKDWFNIKIVGSSDSNVGGIAGVIESCKSISGTVVGTIEGDNAGGVIGYAKSSVEKISVSIRDTSTTVKGISNAGGLVGKMESGTITGGTGGKILNGAKNSGGIVGIMSGGSIEESLMQAKGGNVVASGDDTNAGGLVGRMEGGTIKAGTGGTIEGNDNSYATYVGGLVGQMTGGTISGGTGSDSIKGKTSAGGLVGYMAGNTPIANDTLSDGFSEVQSSYSRISGGTGGTVLSATNVGGVVGEMTAGIISSVTAGDATGSSYAGGIVGKMTGGSISSGANASGKTVSAEKAGGIAGYLSSGGTISGGLGAYASGSSYAGGIVGELNGGQVGAGTPGNANANIAGGIVGLATSGGISANPSNTVTGTTTGGVIGAVNGNVGLRVSTVSGSIGGGYGNGLVGETKNGTLYLNSSVTITATVKYGIVATNKIDIGSGSTDDTSTNSNVTVKATVPLVGTNDTSGRLIHITASGTNLEDIGGSIVGGINKGQISFCANYKNVSSSDTVGGIAQKNEGQIYYCFNSGNITGKIAGGLVGENTGTIDGARDTVMNKGVIKVNNYSECFVGGIAGINSGNIFNAYNTGNISAHIAVSSGNANSYSNSYVNNPIEQTNWFGNKYIIYYNNSMNRAGGIVGKAIGGKTEGHIGTQVKIEADISYKKSGEINDYRGQIAGERVDGTIKNLNGHTYGGSNTITEEENTGGILKTLDENSTKYYYVLVELTHRSISTTAEDVSDITNNYEQCTFTILYNTTGVDTDITNIFKGDKSASSSVIIDDIKTYYTDGTYHSDHKDFILTQSNMSAIFSENSSQPKTYSISYYKSKYGGQGIGTSYEGGMPSDITEEEFGYKDEDNVFLLMIGQEEEGFCFINSKGEYIKDKQYTYHNGSIANPVEWARGKINIDEFSHKIIGVSTFRYVVDSDDSASNSADNPIYNLFQFKTQEYKYSINSQSNGLKITALQDCGGEVTKEDYENSKSTELNQARAIVALYNRCGPCSGDEGAQSNLVVSNETIRSITSISAPTSSSGYYGSGSSGNYVYKDNINEAIVAVARLEYETGVSAGDYHHMGFSSEGDHYGSWNGWTGRAGHWCAAFVTWCGIKAGVCPNYFPKTTVAFSREYPGENNIGKDSKWEWGGVTPQPGWLIVYDWQHTGMRGEGDHIGIVEKVENGIVYTIEGNTTVDGMPNLQNEGYVNVKEHNIDDANILGYVVPNYPVEEITYTYNYQTGEDLVSNIVRALKSAGYSAAATAGIVGNIAMEVGGTTVEGINGIGVQTSLDTDITFDGLHYYGLCMWNEHDFGDVQGKDHAYQINYLIQTMEERFSWSENYKTLTDPKYAADMFGCWYENAGDIGYNSNTGEFFTDTRNGFTLEQNDNSRRTRREQAQIAYDGCVKTLYEREGNAGDLASLSIANKYKTALSKASNSPYYSVVYSALAIASHGSIYYNNDYEHYYDDSYSGEPTSISATYYNISKTVNLIKNQAQSSNVGSWVTDCFGFVRFCYCAGGFNFYKGYAGGYRDPGVQSITSLDNLKPGCVIMQYNYNNIWHAAIYLYHEGNKVYWIDQNLGDIKVSTFSGSTIDNWRYNFHLYINPPN